MLICMSGSNVRRHQLGRTLAGFRKAAGFNQQNAGVLIRRSQSFIAQVEGGALGIRATDLECLLRRYGITDEDTIAGLVELSEAAGQRGWWSVHGLPDWLADYVGLESEATTIRAFELELVPGLLQTPAYARRLHELRGKLTPAEVDERVEARMRRQERLTSPRAPELWAVVSESALRRCRGDNGAEQLHHLAERARLPNVHLQVLPFADGLHSGLSGAFTVLSFPPDVLPDVGWQEYAMGGHLIDDDESVECLSRLAQEIRGQALGADDSLALIADLFGGTEEGNHGI